VVEAMAAAAWMREHRATDDLHHAAAAVASQADTLIAWNLADFGMPP
jgi:hypothetical protein